MKGNCCYAGLVLAAGMSTRMGDFKPLMRLGDKTLIETSVGSLLLGGAEHVTVVTGFRGDEIEQVLAQTYAEKVSFVRNREYASSDMMQSIRLGCSALPACEAFFLLPGDKPMIKQSTFKRLLLARPKGGVAFPTLEGYRKHPPLIDFELVPKILAYKGECGLRGLWKELEDIIVSIPVDDEGVWIDLDTMEDYTRCTQKLGKRCKQEVENENGKNQSVRGKERPFAEDDRTEYLRRRLPG